MSRRRGAKPSAFAVLVRATRLRRRLSLRGLALASGLSFQHIHQLETGKVANPSLDTARRLAGALGLLVEDLLREEPGA